MVADHPVRGQVWEYLMGSRQYRVLIISNDEYNEIPGSTPWGAVVDRSARPIPGYLVVMSAEDPLPGATVVIPMVLRCSPDALRHLLGFVSNTTLNAVERGLREFLNLP